MRRVALAAVSAAFFAVGVWGQGTPARQQAPTVPPSPGVRTPRESEELRGDILMARKLYPEAISVYQGLLKQEPRNAVLLNKIGIAYHEQANLRLASRYYRRSMKADKTYSSAINNLGTVEYEHRKYRKAIRLYDKALLLHGDTATIYSNLGFAYLADKQYDLALATFRKAVELDPTIFEARGSSGSEILQRSTSDPGFFYFFMAKTYALLNNVERCAHYLKMARDEGYPKLSEVQKDPAFARVIKDPRVKEVFQPNAAPGPPAPNATGD